MANVPPEWETTDELGSIEHENGTVGTTPISVPSVADKVIDAIYISNTNTAVAKDLLVSLDGGTSWLTISRLDDKYIELRGFIKQIQIKGAVADVNYEGLIWYGET